MLVRGDAGLKRALLRTALRVLPRRVPLRVRSQAPLDGSGGRTKHCIVLHGWGLDESGMKQMREALRRLPTCAGRRFWSVSYDTQWTTFEDTADRLTAELKSQPFEFEDVIFVGYSMGGIVARSVIASGFPCRAFLAICSPHDGPLPWLAFPGPRTLSKHSPALRALNDNVRDRAHRDRYHLFSITYTDRLGFHNHDGLIPHDSALGMNLGAVASRHTMHLHYRMVAWYDPHWRGKFPQYMPEVLRTMTAIEEGRTVTRDTEKDVAVSDVGSNAGENSTGGENLDGQNSGGQNSGGAGIKPNAKPGDILLFTRARGLNRLITWFTRSRFYHVALFEGEANVIEARPRGVVRRDLNGPDGDRYFVVVPAPEGKGADALAWAQQQIGDGYDPVDVFVIILETLFKSLKINYTSPNKFSCGEYVAQAFQEAGADLFPGQEPSDIIPADFEKFLRQRKNSHR